MNMKPLILSLRLGLQRIILISLVGGAVLIATSDQRAVGQTGNGWVDDGPVVRLENSTDQVGIGTTRPSRKLEVVEDTDAAVSMGVRNPNAGSRATASLALNSDGAQGSLSAHSSSFVSPHRADRVALVAESNAAGLDVVSTGTTGDIRVFTSGYGTGNERMRITPSGDIGIGISRPQEKLHVLGNVRFDDEVRFGLHVGIGVSAGESTLHVRESSGEDATIRLSSGGSWPLIIRQNSASNFAIENGGYKRFAITSQGVEINNAREMPTIRFRGDAGNREGYIEAYDGSGNRNFELRSQFSAAQGAAWLSLNDTARERITLAARNGDTGRGGLIDVKNNSGIPTVRIAGDTGNGSGRVVTSVLEVTGGSDLAEPFQIAEENVEPGSVVVIDSANAGRLKLSSQAYDRKVAGIVSGAGGVNAGMLMGQSNAVTDSVQNVALTGRVYGWADATYGAIQPGDLLTTSDTPGHARRVDDYAKAQGAIIGKAMTALESDRGLVLVLVSLQ